MYTLLTLLLTTTAFALPKPQAFLTGIPGVYIPSRYPGCEGGMPCPEWYMRQVEREGVEKAKSEKKNKQSLTIRQESGEDEAGVFYCKDIGWGGDCMYRTTPLGSAPEDCTQLNLPASSVGPDKGYYCIFYTNAVCAPIASDGSDALTLTFPGTDNLGFTEKGDFNDRLLSYQCFREENAGLDALDENEGEVAQEREDALETMDEQETTG